MGTQRLRPVGRRDDDAAALCPVQVPGLTGVVAVAAGYYHSLAVKTDGTVWAWGDNDYGQLGDGTTTTRMPRCRSQACGRDGGWRLVTAWQSRLTGPSGRGGTTTTASWATGR